MRPQALLARWSWLGIVSILLATGPTTSAADLSDEPLILLAADSAEEPSRLPTPLTAGKLRAPQPNTDDDLDELLDDEEEADAADETNRFPARLAQADGGKGGGGKAANDIKPQQDPAIAALMKRLDDVEKQLKKRDETDKKAADAAAKRFVVRPFGRVHIDAGTFNHDGDLNRQIAPGDAKSGIDLRRARFGFEGEGFDTFFYRFDIDFASFDNQTATRPIIIDSYIDTMNLPYLGNIRVGHFREPMSLDRLDSTNDLPFLERTTVVTALVPFRNMGVMTFNNTEDERATYAAGVFTEGATQYGEQYADHAGVAATGRVTWLPWWDELSDGRYYLHVGLSGSYRRTATQTKSFASTPEFTMHTGLAGGGVNQFPNFVNTGTLPIDDFAVYGGEASLNLGSWAIQAEYYGLSAHQTTVNSPNLFFHGWYVESMYWLTGESRNYNRKTGTHGAVTPHSNFFRVNTDQGIETGWGGWELTSRLSSINLTDENVQGGSMYDVTLGVNWYYTVRSRVMFNYIHSFLDRRALYGNADIFAVRYQWAF